MRFSTLSLALSAATLIHASPILRRHHLDARDEFPAVAAVDAASNRVVLIPGSAADAKRDLATSFLKATFSHVGEHGTAKREVAVPVVSVGDNTVTLLEGTTNSKRDVAVPVVSAGDNIVTLLEGTTNSKRDVAVPVVSAGDNIVTLLEGTTNSKRDVAVPVVSAGDNIVTLLEGTTNSKRDVAVPVVSAGDNIVTLLEGTTNSKRAADGIVPTVVNGNQIVSVAMTAENTA